MGPFVNDSIGIKITLCIKKYCQLAATVAGQWGAKLLRDWHSTEAFYHCSLDAFSAHICRPRKI